MLLMHRDESLLAVSALDDPFTSSLADFLSSLSAQVMSVFEASGNAEELMDSLKRLGSRWQRKVLITKSPNAACSPH